MKYLYSACSCIVLLLSACNRDPQAAFEVQPAFADGTEIAKNLSTQLTGAANGWGFIISKSMTQPIENLEGYLRFSNDQSFGVAAGYSSRYATYTTGNGYELYGDRYLAKLRLKTTGQGRLSQFGNLVTEHRHLDTVYSYRYTAGDTLFFLGEQWGLTLRLFAVGKEEADLYEQNIFKEVIMAKDMFTKGPRFFYNMVFDGVQLFFYNSERNGYVFHYMDGNIEKYHTTEFAYGRTGIQLKNPLTLGGITIASLDAVRLAADSSIQFSKGSVSNSVAPAFYKSAAANFIRLNPNDVNNYGLWISDLGWSARNRPDLLGMKAYDPGMQNIFISDQVLEGTRHNRVGLGLFPGWSWWRGDKGILHRVSNGLVFFENANVLYAATTIATVADIQNRNQRMYTSSGYYVLNTIRNQVVLVRADNAENWIFFQ